MASDGACYGCSFIHDAFWLEGKDIGAAVDTLLLGRKARPMLRPGQSKVVMYGRAYVSGDPEVLVWSGTLAANDGAGECP